MKVLLPRNTEVGARFLDSVAAVWDQEAFWLKCIDPKNTSKPPATCIGKWSSKNKPTGVALSADKKWFDWSNTAVQDWYLHTYLNSSIHDDLYDGAYFDCSCGKPPGAILPPGFEDGHAKTWAAANKLLADNRKWGSAWAGGNILNPTASQKQCRFLFGHLIDNGALPNQTVQFQYSGGNFTLAVAGVLLARGRDATFVNRVQGAYDASITDYKEFAENATLVNRDYGVPLGRATCVGGDNVDRCASLTWTRQWSKATVTISCDNTTDEPTAHITSL